jgi:hypothetical protein
MTTPSFISPDMTLIRDSRETIRYQATIGSADLYIEALRNELLNLNAGITETDLLVSNTLTSSIIALQTEELSDTLEAVRALTSSEQNTASKEIIEFYSKTANKLIVMCIDKLEELRGTLSNGVFSVRHSTISNNRFRLAELAEVRTSLSNELDIEKVPLEGLFDDEKTLNEAIRLFESLTYIDRLKPLLKQLTGLIGTQPETLQTAAMKAGLEVANKLLDEANELIKYQGLIKARNTLRVRLMERQARVTSLQAQLNDNDKKTKQLRDTQKVIEPRNIYADETNKIVDSLSLFLDVVTQPAQGDVQKKGDRLIAHAKALLPHLKSLKGQWLRG